ncbi:MarR family transcriptional regulator [Comamonas phosphati]|nr:MarR family transcriptional regulator [Comamonas phosphati]
MAAKDNTPAVAATDLPGREAGLSHDDHQAVRLWLRLLTCSTQIEQVIRTQLRTQFGTTLPRFDYLAQLSRFPQGLRMKTLSEYLMVTGGNVTGLTDQLVAEGWVERIVDNEDRRSMIVRMTRSGNKQFGAMAEAHEQWLEQLLLPLGQPQVRELYDQLGLLRQVLSDANGKMPQESSAYKPIEAGPRQRFS